MSIIWGEKEVGTSIMLIKEDHDFGDETAILIGADIPDWIRIPEQVRHEDAGKVFRVKFPVIKKCACEHEHKSMWLILERSQLCIIECNMMGWLTVRMKK